MTPSTYRNFGVTRLRSLNLRQTHTQLCALARAVLLFGASELLVRSTSLPRAAKLCGCIIEFTDRAPGRDLEGLEIDPSQRRALAMLSRVARRWPFGPNGACLRHSLSAAYVLRSRSPILRLAVGSLETTEVTAHAWLEVDGTAVTDPGGEYLPLLDAVARGAQQRQ
jgi:hypothetical protein